MTAVCPTERVTRAGEKRGRRRIGRRRGPPDGGEAVSRGEERMILNPLILVVSGANERPVAKHTTHEREHRGRPNKGPAAGSEYVLILTGLPTPAKVSRD